MNLEEIEEELQQQVKSKYLFTLVIIVGDPAVGKTSIVRR